MKMKSIRIAGLILSLCEIVIGVLLLINPVGFTVGIVTFLGIVLLLAGIANVIQYFRSEPAAAAIERNLANGLIEILVGIFCVTKSGWFIATFPVFTVIYGVLTLVTGITKIQWTVDMVRVKVKKWGWLAADAVITILCAAVILCNPFSTTAILWMFVAISLIVEAVIDVIALIFAKNEKV